LPIVSLTPRPRRSPGGPAARCEYDPRAGRQRATVPHRPVVVDTIPLSPHRLAPSQLVADPRLIASAIPRSLRFCGRFRGVKIIPDLRPRPSVHHHHGPVVGPLVRWGLPENRVLWPVKQGRQVTTYDAIQIQHYEARTDHLSHRRIKQLQPPIAARPPAAGRIRNARVVVPQWDNLDSTIQPSRIIRDADEAVRRLVVPPHHPAQRVHMRRRELRPIPRRVPLERHYR